MQTVAVSVTAERHSKTQQGHLQMGSWVGDSLLRVKAPSSLLTQSCLLSSSPDALVRLCLGPGNKDKPLNKRLNN